MNYFRFIYILAALYSVSSPYFFRKGIFPKEPPKFFKGVNKTYYLIRDIKFLANEKLLSKFREIKAYQKKIVKATKKKQKFDAKHLIENKPTYNLVHIIKERYPRFIDALHDIDDALLKGVHPFK